MPAQTYATHRKWVPLWHYIATPIALLGLGKSLYDLRFGTDLHAIEKVVFMVGFAATAYLARQSAVTVQNRLIRLEERLRLQSVLPEGMRGRISELSTSQLIGLRFAVDGELAGLVERCVSGELKGAEQVKKEIRTWRPDELRA